ncbi:MAG: hypothetical protein P4M13_08735 [Alphaproteobacteria bacterium]|nr:hypothetical protein [Alphaproteobacteria bacterium]
MGIENNRVAPCRLVGDVEIAKRGLGDPFAFFQFVLDATADVIGKLVGVGLRHNRAHVPHQLLHAVGVFVDDVAFADKVDFEQVLFHQRVQDGRMGKTALQSVNAIDDQGDALFLLADKFDQTFEFGAMAFG